MKRLILTLILICAFSLALAICANASYGIFDEIGVLSNSEEVEIEEALHKASNKTGLSFYVGLIEENSLFYSSFVSRNYLDTHNTVLLLIDDLDRYTDGFCYTLHLFGDAVDRISVGEENRILDSLRVKKLKEEDGSGLVSGICAFAKLTARKAGNSAGITSGTVILCIVISVLGASGIFLLIVIKRYKKKKRGTSYPFDQFTKLELTDSSDVFLTKTVTRRRYRSSSSSSGSSGSRSSGGGSRSSGGSRSRSSSRR